MSENNSIPFPRPRRIIDSRDIDLKKLLTPEQYAEELAKAKTVIEGPDLRVGELPAPPETILPPKEAFAHDEARIRIVVEVWQLPTGAVQMSINREGSGNPTTQTVGLGFFNACKNAAEQMAQAVDEQNAVEGARRKDIENQQHNKEKN